jgi:hypothetical protein
MTDDMSARSCALLISVCQYDFFDCMNMGRKCLVINSRDAYTFVSAACGTYAFLEDDRPGVSAVDCCHGFTATPHIHAAEAVDRRSTEVNQRMQPMSAAQNGVSNTLGT